MVKLKIKTNLGKIETDNPNLLSALIDRYTFTDPGARYSPAYRRGVWDGKKRFITPTGKFATGLLSKILEDLALVNCIPEIEYLDKREYEYSDYKISKWDLRDYQDNLIKKALEAKRCVIQAPTGAGKTLILGSLIKALKGYKILCLFNTKQLVSQTYDYLTKKHPKGLDLEKLYGIKVGINFSDGFIYNDVMICSVFSIDKLIGTPMESPDVLIVDECHEFCTGSFTSEVIQSFPTAQIRIGLTATPPKDKIKLYTLEGALGPVIRDVTTSGLVEQGKLAKPDIQVMVLTPNQPNDLEDYSQIYDKYIINNKRRNSIIKDIAEKFCNDNDSAKVLILVKNLEHGRILQELLPNAFYLQGSDDLAARKKDIKKFRESTKSEIMIGTKILQTGVDIPEISHYINARGLKSEIATIQALGRSIRQYKGLDTVYVYDFVDTVKYLEDHSIKRVRAYKGEGHKVTIHTPIKYDVE